MRALACALIACLAGCTGLETVGLGGDVPDRSRDMPDDSRDWPDASDVPDASADLALDAGLDAGGWDASVDAAASDAGLADAADAQPDTGSEHEPDDDSEDRERER